MVQARPYWPHLIGIFLLNLLSTPLSLVKPFVLSILIDSAFGSHPVPGAIRVFFPVTFEFTFGAVVTLSAALAVLIALLDNLNGVALWILGTFTGEKLVLEFRTLLFDHTQRLSLAYHDRQGTSDSLYRIQWDTTGIRTFLMGNLSPLLSSTTTLVAMVAVMFLINWQFALIALGVMPPLFILTRISSSRLSEDWSKVKQDESGAMSVVHEVLSALRVVKAFGQEEAEIKRFTNQATQAVKGQLRVAWVGAIFYFVVGIIFAIGTASFIYLGAMRVKSGQMTLGELTLVIAYLAQVFGPLQSISKSFNDIQSSLASLDRVLSLLDTEREVEENPHTVHLPRAKGSFEFRHVSFFYDQEKPALKDISFQINPGDRVGVMGSTGAGKSTLVSLLTRFYDPSAGNILMDGVDIRNYRLANYRGQFGIVLQEPILFSTTVEENIRYGRPGASNTEVIEAAKAANAHDFIINGKDGYQTMVGERGTQLSGGERQRISLARAFIKNAPVLVLDEPTSSIDVKTEALIMDALERLMEGRTTFMITHRLDTLHKCNVILHLEKNELINTAHNEDARAFEEMKKAFLSSVHF